MSKVITFSRVFPKYHPRAGQPTYFVEQLYKSIGIDIKHMPPQVFQDFNYDVYTKSTGKSHTIRSGNRWKVGDKFSPRVWSGKPYASPQVVIAPDIQIKKIWDIGMDENCVFWVNGKYLKANVVDLLAKNDGLDISDFYKWFMPNWEKPKLFSGQIICWDENIKY